MARSKGNDICFRRIVKNTSAVTMSPLACCSTRLANADSNSEEEPTRITTALSPAVRTAASTSSTSRPEFSIVWIREYPELCGLWVEVRAAIRHVSLRARRPSCSAPVIFARVRFRLPPESSLHGVSVADGEYDRNSRGRCLCCLDGRDLAPWAKIRSTRTVHQLCGEARQAVVLTFRPSIFNSDILAFI